jgi:uncharacterized membrane protein
MSIEDEYSAKKAAKPRNKWQPFLYALGFIIILVVGAASYFLSEPAFRELRLRVSGFPSQPEVRFVVAGAIFLIVIMVLSMIYAAFQPRMPRGVSEQDLDREKRERQKEMDAAKRRKKEMQAKMRARNKEGGGR